MIPASTSSETDDPPTRPLVRPALNDPTSRPRRQPPQTATSARLVRRTVRRQKLGGTNARQVPAAIAGSAHAARDRGNPGAGRGRLRDCGFRCARSRDHASRRPTQMQGVERPRACRSSNVLRGGVENAEAIASKRPAVPPRRDAVSERGRRASPTTGAGRIARLTHGRHELLAAPYRSEGDRVPARRQLRRVNALTNRTPIAGEVCCLTGARDTRSGFVKAGRTCPARQGRCVRPGPDPVRSWRAERAEQ
jgi:hypothetical protein